MSRKAHSPLPQPLFGEPVFSEGAPSPDPKGFKKPHPSDKQQYKALGDLLKKDVVSFDPSRGKPGDLYALESAWGPHGPEVVQGITKAGRIVFHAAGDTGASNSGKYPDEIRVADQLTQDCHTAAAADRPNFFYHLGDVVYSFGESQYYYDQFYEPFRNYPGPIFAIPGNHDSFVIPGTPDAQAPLNTFRRNFCGASPGVTAEAASLHRTSMTQPGVYFTLDAPFVRIIGLFSNSLEDPGLISSEKGTWTTVPDVQLDYLTAQLQRIKAENYQGAVLLATHHPAFSYSPPARAGGAGGNHGCSPAMLGQIDTICKAAGVYPHAFLSGHAHNYQRFTRKVQFGGANFDVPFIVCGDGGHNVTSIVRANRGQVPPEPGDKISVNYLDTSPKLQTTGLRLEKHDDTNYGYLQVTVDKKQLRVGFHQVGKTSIPQSRIDMVTIDLASHTMVAS